MLCFGDHFGFFGGVIVVHALFLSMLHCDMLDKSVNLSHIYTYWESYKD